jgi:hypothetical protein
MLEETLDGDNYVEFDWIGELGRFRNREIVQKLLCPRVCEVSFQREKFFWAFLRPLAELLQVPSVCLLKLQPAKPTFNLGIIVAPKLDHVASFDFFLAHTIHFRGF